MMVTEHNEPDDSAIDVESNSNAKLFFFINIELGRSTSGVARGLSVVAVNYVRLLCPISSKHERGKKIAELGGHVDHF